MRETQVQSLRRQDQEDAVLGRSPGEVMRPSPVFLPGESHGRKSLAGCSHGVAKSRSRLSDFTFTFHFHFQGIMKHRHRRQLSSNM